MKSSFASINILLGFGKKGFLINLKTSYLVTALQLKVEMVHKEPHLILVALHDIGVGEELTYDYGIKYYY